tara:strand:+ start:183 stop:656 length:474 start_codon:yes stop_codon:yes gene_type:complete
MKLNENTINNISMPMSTEGTTNSPRKFTLTEISDRVKLALTNNITEELDCTIEELEEYTNQVASKLRSLGRIKKEMSDYNLVQEILAYRVLNPKVDSGLLQDLYNKGTYTITITPEEKKVIRNLINPRSETNKTWTIKKGLKGEVNSTYSSNFGTIK